MGRQDTIQAVRHPSSDSISTSKMSPGLNRLRPASAGRTADAANQFGFGNQFLSQGVTGSGCRLSLTVHPAFLLFSCVGRGPVLLERTCSLKRKCKTWIGPACRPSPSLFLPITGLRITCHVLCTRMWHEGGHKLHLFVIATGANAWRHS